MAESAGGSPRRVVTGLVQSRLNTVVAILSRHLRINMSTQDVYASTVGGINVHEPAADLALAAAILSSRGSLPLPRSTVAIGELSLAGELRPVPGIDRRLKEAHRLGFHSAILPKDDGIKVPKGMHVVQTDSLEEAMTKLFDPGLRPPPRPQPGARLADVIKLDQDDVWDA